MASLLTGSLHTGLQTTYRLSGELVFDTAWRFGSGKEGETMSDLGVLLDTMGQPVLPGSSLKGRFRSTCESLAHSLGLSACFLDHEASGIPCVSDVDYYHRVRPEYRQASASDLESRLEWIDGHTCDVCKLFGSPVMAGRIRFSDALLREWAGIVQVRDGVVIDRDSHTAVDRLKYDYEVVPPGAKFSLAIELENPGNQELAIVGASLIDWASGSSLGGFTSRGLGRFHLESLSLSSADLSDPQQRIRFLTSADPAAKLTSVGDWESFFSPLIEQQLESLAPETED